MTEPRNHTARNPQRATIGPKIAKVAAAFKRPLMPWQRAACDVLGEVDEDGRLWHNLIVISVPRQAGKTTLTGLVSEERAMTRRDARIWFTAQSGKDADRWMREEHFGLIPAPLLARADLSRRAGAVGVKWPHSGGSFLTFPPKDDALHGAQSDLVTVDEAWSHSPETGRALRQAIRPTMITRRDPQLIIVSTRGDGESSMLDHYLAIGRDSLQDKGTRIAYVDYGLRDGEDPNDLDLVFRRHPAAGHTLTMQALEAARADFGDDVNGFARAFGNVATPTAVAILPPGSWDAAATARTEIPAAAHISLDATPDGSHFAIVATWADPSGKAIQEIVDAGPTTEPAAVAAMLADVARAKSGGVIALDRMSIGALDIASRAAQLLNTDLVFLGTNEFAAACSAWRTAVVTERLGFVPHPDMDAAVAGASERPLGDGGVGWRRKESNVSIAPLVAATVGLHRLQHAPPTLPKPRLVTNARV